MRFRLLVVVTGLVSGCAFDVPIPPTTQLACAKDGDCPSALACKSERCVDPRLNNRPVLVVANARRGIDSVTITAHVVDDEGDTGTVSARVDGGGALVA